MRTLTSSRVETPSGKDAEYENFPVGSWLISPKLRPHIHTFYNFARVIDDIADSSKLNSKQKIVRLNGFENAISGVNRGDSDFLAGHQMRESLVVTEGNPQHCFDLIKAFKQDAVKTRYVSWTDLLYYCSLSAAPVGRYLLDLHGETADKYSASDSLCSALQILNHLQDCRDDFRSLDRVYLPLNFFEDEKLVYEALTTRDRSKGFELGWDRILAKTNVLLGEAEPLPSLLRSRRLSMEAQTIIKVAQCLSKKLSVYSPLDSRVKLNKFQYIWCCIAGIAKIFALVN